MNFLTLQGKSRSTHIRLQTDRQSLTRSKVCTFHIADYWEVLIQVERVRTLTRHDRRLWSHIWLNYSFPFSSSTVKKKNSRSLTCMHCSRYKVCVRACVHGYGTFLRVVLMQWALWLTFNPDVAFLSKTPNTKQFCTTSYITEFKVLNTIKAHKMLWIWWTVTEALGSY